MKTLKTNYRGFEIETSMDQLGSGKSIASLNGVLKFGTCSHLDTLSSHEKIQSKIDKFLLPTP